MIPLVELWRARGVELESVLTQVRSWCHSMMAALVFI